MIAFNAENSKVTSDSFSLLLGFLISELKRRMKAEKKAAEKETKLKDQQEQKASNDQGDQHAGGDEETLDPNVRFLYSHTPLITAWYSFEKIRASVPIPVQYSQ